MSTNTLLYTCEVLKLSALLLAIFELLPETRRRQLEDAIARGVERLANESLRLLTTLFVLGSVGFLAMPVIPAVLSVLLFFDFAGLLVPSRWRLIAGVAATMAFIVNLVAPRTISVFLSPIAFAPLRWSQSVVERGYLLVCPNCSAVDLHLSTWAINIYFGSREWFSSWVGGWWRPFRASGDIGLFLGDILAAAAVIGLSLILILLLMMVLALAATASFNGLFKLSERAKIALDSEKSRIPIGGTALYVLGEAVIFMVTSIRYFSGQNL